MKLRVLLAGVAVAAVCSDAAAQLTCSTSGSDQCDALHYHVNVWDHEAKQYVELYGHNTFSTLEACEAARKTEADLNAAALLHLQRNAPRVKLSPGKFGACHCDMTDQKSHPNFLDETRRIAMKRRERELELAMVELLVDNKATMDNEMIRAYLSGSSALSVSTPYWPREVAFVAVTGSKLLDEAGTRLQPSTVQTVRAAGVVGASIDLTPVDLAPHLFGAPEAEVATTSTTDIAFLSAEMARMSAMLQQVAENTDSSSEEVLERFNERIQVLTNLGKVAESGGERSRLAEAMRNASNDTDRSGLIERLFGPLVAQHWAPASPKDMGVPVPPTINGDPVAVLRDTSGRFTEDERKIALFSLMATSSDLTETEEIWLAGILDSSFAK